MKHTFVWLMALALTFPQISTAESTDMTKGEQNALAAIEAMTAAFQNNVIARWTRDSAIRTVRRCLAPAGRWQLEDGDRQPTWCAAYPVRHLKLGAGR